MKVMKPHLLVSELDIYISVQLLNRFMLFLIFLLMFGVRLSATDNFVALFLYLVHSANLLCCLCLGVISLLEHNEDYVITFPSTYCRYVQSGFFFLIIELLSFLDGRFYT